LNNTDLNTMAELDTLIADENVIGATEIDTSSELLTIVGDETGTGVLVFGTAPTFTTSITTPSILTGNVALSIGDATTDSITFASDGTGNGEFTFPADVIGDADIDWGSGAGQISVADLETSDNIILATEIDTSSELLTIVGDETGSGALVFGTAPTFTTSIQVGAAGVVIAGPTEPTDGTITFLGAGAGADEDLTLNFDDTANTIVASTSTGVTSLDFGTSADIGITANNFVADVGGVSIAASQAYTGAGAVNITSGANGLITLTPNGTGDVVLSTDADTNVQVTASAAPGVDIMSISNSGQASTTAGVDGLSVTFGTSNASGNALTLVPSYTGGAATNTYNVIGMAAFSPTNAAGTDIINGIDFGEMNDPGATITSYAINFSDGWDYAFKTVDDEISITELGLLDGKTTMLIDSNDLTAADGAGVTSSGSGMEAGTGGIGLLQGCAEGQVLSWDEAGAVWECSSKDIKYDVFAADGSWSKPTDAILVIVEVWGGGGGGGGGTGGTTAASRSGGGGGGGGGFVTSQIAAASLGATVYADVGAGGTAGTAGSSAVGTEGGTGGASCFASSASCANTVYARAYGGGGGGGDGTAGNGGGGGGGSHGAG
ncbi:MAG: hypothetical protein WC702_04515, partial [Patescibacteria group bacterium]